MRGGVSVERSHYSEVWREEPAGADALKGNTLLSASAEVEMTELVARGGRRTLAAFQTVTFLTFGRWC